MFAAPHGLTIRAFPCRYVCIATSRPTISKTYMQKKKKKNPSISFHPLSGVQSHATPCLHEYSSFEPQSLSIIGINMHYFPPFTTPGLRRSRFSLFFFPPSDPTSPPTVLNYVVSNPPITHTKTRSPAANPGRADRWDVFFFFWQSTTDNRLPALPWDAAPCMISRRTFGEGLEQENLSERRSDSLTLSR